MHAPPPPSHTHSTLPALPLFCALPSLKPNPATPQRPSPTLHPLLSCDPKGSRAFLRILCMEGRGVHLCWGYTKTKGPTVFGRTGKTCPGLYQKRAHVKESTRDRRSSRSLEVHGLVRLPTHTSLRQQFHLDHLSAASCHHCQGTAKSLMRRGGACRHANDAGCAVAQLAIFVVAPALDRAERGNRASIRSSCGKCGFARQHNDGARGAVGAPGQRRGFSSSARRARLISERVLELPFRARETICVVAIVSGLCEGKGFEGRRVFQ